MIFKLGKNVKVGQKIKTKTMNGWRKIKSLTKEGVIVSDGELKFGDTIYGWKSK